MADLKTTAFTAINGIDVADADLYDVVDVSDTTMDATGTNKKQTRVQAAIALSQWIEAEVDFGSVGVASKSFTVTDGNVTSTMKIAVLASGNTATSRVGNDFEWDAIQFSAKAGTGNFALAANVLNGHVRGRRKILYNLSA